MILADKIIMLRKKNGWSQEELAEQMNVSRQSVSKWEGAQAVPDLEKIIRLSQILGVSTDYLLKDEMEETAYTACQEELSAVRRVSMEEAVAFLKVKGETAGQIALATFICILSPICLFLLVTMAEAGRLAISENAACGIGLFILILMVTAAVAIFISCGSKTSPYEYLEKEAFETEYGVTGMVKERQKQYRDTYTRNNVVGTCICILSAIPLFAGAFMESQGDIGAVSGLCMTLLLVGIGVIFFIRSGVVWESMKKLLQEGEYTKENKRKSSIIGAISGAYWLVMTAIYLAYSFSTNHWQSSWIIWPVAGVLYAAVIILMGVLIKAPADKRHP